MSARDAGPGVAAVEAGEALAQRVLELVRDRATGAEAEALVRTGTSALTRFANGFIHQNVAEDLSEVSVRVALDGRVAATRLDGPPDEDRLRALVAGAFAAAMVSPVDPDWPGVAAPAPVDDPGHWDDETAKASPDARAELVAAFVAAAPGLVTAGALSTDAVHVTFANSAGQAIAGRGTVATIDGIARTGTSDGVARASAVALGSINANGAGEWAARKARDGANPTDLEPGRYEVVLEASCTANILALLVMYGYAGRPVREGRSFVKLGERQLDLALTVRQDVADHRLSGLGFDAEGTPRLAVDLVRGGVSSAVLLDRRGAHKAGTASTGNAAPPPDTWGEVPASLVLEPGEARLDALVAGIERGLLVSDFWYTRVLDPRSIVVTGLTRNGVWLVEDGRIVRPVTNLRFTQSYPDALAPGSVRAIGSDAALFPDGLTGACSVPSLHLGSWNFTGGAKG